MYIWCRPEEDNALAKFTCRADGQEERLRPPPEPGEETDTGEWALFMPFGSYEIEAVLGDGDVRTDRLDARPPLFRVRLARP